eukprot:CAMPEP_0202469640 /NCGR_PEP_ID=MMETSP1360-20130828/79143_1 /ASSEMBLY_ACC=CAM_ASM_000848 /TAXON_ID=515479 /ORGANISM="Licmophora paradoxa, Strain CCMP2313" /LENGTH=114 /DNA_ID=CAMNT_0049095051 /DNA_START=13 /DNA_END=357 /DNA_ORIENTATION=+
MTKLNLQATAADENGYTLLHAAAAYNQRSVMEFLLQQQSNPNAQDNEGDTPLHHVDQVEAAKFLIEVAGANPKITNTESKTALQAKQDELRDQMEDDEDDVEDLKHLVNYLQTR